jgi:AraC-like DNA-binding protein
MIKRYDFFKRKYGEELLIDLIRLESLEKYITDAEPHTLSYFDITLITEGAGLFQIDDYSFPIDRNAVYFTVPNQIRRWNIEKVPKGLVLIFEKDFLCNFFNDTRFVQNLSFFNANRKVPYLKLSDPEYEHISVLMLSIETEIASFRATDTHILRALLYQVLIWFNRKYSASPETNQTTNQNRHIVSFINLLEKHYRNHHDVGFYAEELHITAGHLNDLTCRHLGKTAKHCIKEKILLEAKRMLAYTDLSISEIASGLNFEDTSYFIRLFRNSTGLTPLSFRKK